MSRFEGKLQLDFGDFGSVGRYAMTLSPIRWICDVPGYQMDIIIPGNEDPEYSWITDGTTLPSCLWWFLPQWGHPSTVAAILHDYLLWCLDSGKPLEGCTSRSKCDRQYYYGLLCTGVGPIKSWLAFLGVRAYSITYAALTNRGIK